MLTKQVMVTVIGSASSVMLVIVLVTLDSVDAVCGPGTKEHVAECVLVMITSAVSCY
jgi:hypothetical protein